MIPVDSFNPHIKMKTSTADLIAIKSEKSETGRREKEKQHTK